MHSCIYTGKVRHRRFEPVEHEFTYSIYLIMLDLEELDDVFSRRLLWSTKFPNFAWFRQQDHLRSRRTNGSRANLRELLQSFLTEEGVSCDGPIRLLTQLRYCGFVMNPVSFYYCYHSDGKTLNAIVAQVNNTPWGEEHLYLVEANESKSKLTSIKNLAKEFHVSPFMPMDMTYSMQFTDPSSKLAVRMTNYQQQIKMLDVVMTLERKKLSTLNLMSLLFSYPMISFKVFAAIYWQAFKIYSKKIPFFTHPKKLEKSTTIEQSFVKATD